MKSHGHSQSSSSSSHLRLTCKTKNEASSKTPKIISKYFMPSNFNDKVQLNVSKEEAKDGHCSTSDESPYKGFMSEIKSINVNASASEETDFKTPRRNNTNKLKRPKDFKKSKQMVLTKSVNSTGDINEEHFQLALALSKSLTQNHKSETEEKCDVKEYPCTQQKLANVRQTLLQFRFGANATKVEVQHPGTNLQIKKKTKRSKFRYVTPILYLRTQEDREKLISEKVGLILSRNLEKDTEVFERHLLSQTQPKSVILQKQLNSENKFFKMNGYYKTGLDDQDIFYVKSLQIPYRVAKCGNLLKDWSDIPGREKSPTCDKNSKNHKQSIFKGSEISKESSDENTKLESSVDNDHCVSPDLFGSDDDLQFKNDYSLVKASKIDKSINENDISDNSDSESLISYISPTKRQSLKKINSSSEKIAKENESKYGGFSSTSDEEMYGTTDKGIFTYESFCKGTDNYFELTHFSDEESKCKEKTHGHAELNKDTLQHTCEAKDTAENKMDISDVQSSSYLSDEVYHLEIARQGKSLNVTEYVHNMLNNDQEMLNTNFENIKMEDILIDLTQSSSDSSHHTSPSKLLDKEIKNSNSSGDIKKDLQRHESFKSTTSDDLMQSQTSQESICISDEELNYSSAFQKSYLYDKNNYEFSDCDSVIESKVYKTNDAENITPKTTKNLSNIKCDNSNKIYESNLNDNRSEENTTPNTFDNLEMLLENLNSSTSPRSSEIESIETNSTPKSNVLIKTANITPMANYNIMDTPKINIELQKFGLKPLKRRRGIQILKHIYETTHPIVNEHDHEQSESDEDDKRIIKRKKKDTKVLLLSSNDDYQKDHEKIEIIGELMTVNETVDDLIFERKQSKKVHSCRVPLHIAWHNLLSAQPELRKNVLLYEPLQLEVLYNVLKEQGYKYHIEDLLTFLDRKCITIRTNQNQERNKHNRKKKSVSPKKRKSTSPKKSKSPRKTK